MKSWRTVIAVVAIVLFAAGCAGRSGTGPEEGATAVSGDFAELSDVCGPGKATSASARGVTANDISVGVFTDLKFSKKSDFVDAATVFTSWCNAAGGVGGRKLVTEIRDTNMSEVRQRMLEACRSDFALVGGGAALDGLGVEDRLTCLLPDFPAQVGQVRNIGSDLQVSAAVLANPRFDQWFGYRQWLVRAAYPASAGAVGIIAADSPITKVGSVRVTEAFTALGATLVYNDLYPAQGVTDWTPYAQAIKNKGVKGLVWYGHYTQLPPLLDVLTKMDYKLDWVDANSASYTPDFIPLASGSLSNQKVYADLGGSAPVEAAATVPAIAQVEQLYARYAPKARITLPVTTVAR